MKATILILLVFGAGFFAGYTFYWVRQWILLIKRYLKF